MPYSVPGVIRSDIAATRHVEGRLGPFLFPHVYATASYRIASAVRRAGHPVLARGISCLTQVLTGAELSPLSDIGPGLHLRHTSGVIIGPGVVAGERLTLFAQVILGSNFGESRHHPRMGFPHLGDDVQVMTRASVIGPVTVGDRAIVGAHALVLSDVPADAIAKGVPARCS